MQNLKVTLVQADQVWEDKAANFKNYQSLLAETNDTDLIILPEMFNTGFSMNAELLAEKLNDSKSIKWLKELSVEKDAAVYTSLIIEEGGLYFNRGVFIEPSGKIQFYDKRKTFGLAGEDLVFQSGQKAVIIEYKEWKINLQICYDLRFPELCLNSIENNRAKYDLSIYVANWPEKRIAHWNALLVARAIENQAYVIGVNRIGKDKNELVYTGESQVIDPYGKSLKNDANENCETTLILEGKLGDLRQQLPFLKDR